MTGIFQAHMEEATAERRLVVQPRMGFAQVPMMRAGLEAVRRAPAAPAVGTLTVDAYTRVGDFETARQILLKGARLNGFPIVSHGAEATREMLAGILEPSFPVQVRHGSAKPMPIFCAAAGAGLDAIEGGPVSYTLPYSRTPLPEAVVAWGEAVRFWAQVGEKTGAAMHIESFAGCMLGQLCPPGLLAALGILEGLFFREHGIRSLSLSLTQGASDDQDTGALIALRRLADRWLGNIDRHVVFYAFMGLFPETWEGALALMERSARIAARGGAQRLIVKTVAEAHGIPTVEDNVAALVQARTTADAELEAPEGSALTWADAVEDEAERLLAGALALGGSAGEALVNGFAAGALDVPFCPHPSNRNAARTAIDPDTGALFWADPGAMPLPRYSRRAVPPLTAAGLSEMLTWNRRRYDSLLPGEGAKS